jgi:hypothetical protein
VPPPAAVELVSGIRRDPGSGAARSGEEEGGVASAHGIPEERHAGDGRQPIGRALDRSGGGTALASGEHLVIIDKIDYPCKAEPDPREERLSGSSGCPW